MSNNRPIDFLSIYGFKSIKKLENLKLRPLNILIGANGVGKSNFVSYFRMLNEMIEGRLQSWVKKQGGADRIVYLGIKETAEFSSHIRFKPNEYSFTLEVSDDGSFFFNEETIYFQKAGYSRPYYENIYFHFSESGLKNYAQNSKVAQYCYDAISSWRVYHLHDTSETAGVKRSCSLVDNAYLRNNASNLAAFLYLLKEQYTETYQQIVKIVQLAIPFFNDFVLEPDEFSVEEKQIRLFWKQKDSDYKLSPNQLSDGSIRFICLATALLQPNPPSTIIIDEPELGLHPYALTLLASLLRHAANRMQVIVSTQSICLIDEFTLEDLIVVERENGETIFKRLNNEEFNHWLEDYTISELWQKNILGGRPRK